MSNKPENELWMVILNEFTDAGLDALSVAESARGRYDVRLVAGGCLCCVGELEFGKQLRDILRNFKPARLLIEPSGAGHAADIVDALSLYESQGALSLDSIICLVDALDAERILRLRSRQRVVANPIGRCAAAVEARPRRRARARRHSTRSPPLNIPSSATWGAASDGELPREALQRFTRSENFSFVQTTAGRRAGSCSAVRHRRPDRPARRRYSSWGCGPSAGYCRVNSCFREVVIEPRLNWLLDAYPGRCRLKAVLRTGPGPSWLIQSHGRGLSGEDSAYRRDSRMEIVLDAAPTAKFLDQWRILLREAANPR